MPDTGVQVHCFILRNDNRGNPRLFRYVDGSMFGVETLLKARLLLRMRERGGKFLYGEVIIGGQPTDETFGNPQVKQDWLDYEASLGRKDIPGDGTVSWFARLAKSRASGRSFVRAVESAAEGEKSALETLARSPLPPKTPEARAWEAYKVRVITINEINRLICCTPTPKAPSLEELDRMDPRARRRGKRRWRKVAEFRAPLRF
jgi:hypothetical protein